MTPSDNSDDSLHIYADWLIDEQLDEEANHLRQSLNSDSEDDPLYSERSMHVRAFCYKVGVNKPILYEYLCKPGVGNDVGEDWGVGTNFVSAIPGDQ